MIDRSALFGAVRTALFPNGMKQSQRDGIGAILDGWERDYPNGDRRCLAYILATAHHETDRTMEPIREYGRGKGKPYGVPDPETGHTFFGRGLCQLTWKDNYAHMSEVVGVDLVAEPDLALELPIAVKILLHGMVNGSFTGKRLAEYFNGSAEDWNGARRIINGTDRATKIAELGRGYYAALRGAAEVPR